MEERERKEWSLEGEEIEVRTLDAPDFGLGIRLWLS